MKKMLKGLSLSVVIFMYVICLPSMAITKYTDGRFIKNTKVHECMRKIVMQHKDYKSLSNEYSICSERIRFSFSAIKQVGKVHGVGIRVPVANNIKGSVISFRIRLCPKNDLSSLELVNLFLTSNEFNERDFQIKVQDSVIYGNWEPDNENEYDNKYSLMTDITEENWREKFSDEESVIPELCPGSLIFFEIRPGEKVFVEGYEK